MKRIHPLLLAVSLAALGSYACSHKSGSTNNNGSSTDPNSPDPGSTTPGDGTTPGSDGPIDKNQNPIEGIAPAKVTLDTGAYTDGPVWHAAQGVLFFSTPLGEGGLYRMRPDGSAAQVRAGNKATGAVPIGNAVDKAGELITFDAKMITRGGAAADAGPPGQVAAGYPGEAGVAPFDTLKAGVVRDDGTMYVTDPGYFAAPMANRIYRVATNGTVSIVESFDDVPRPNGIALSPDQKTLYVGFTSPQQGTMPFVRRYIVNDDGTIGEHAKLADVDPADSQPDGIEVDKAGNLYIAMKTGILVLKDDGTKIGDIPVADQPTGSAFGGADMKTLYITTQGTKIYEVHVNVPGIAQ
jgi:gluconolactonase